jgi:signal peptidase I
MGARKKSVVREYAEAFALAILLALAIRTFVVQAFKIPSGSMIPTLSIGDHILVNKFVYGVKIPFTDQIVIPMSLPERGDIIVFKFPGDESKDYIKRVVGTPGDVVEVRNKAVYVNGILADTTHIQHIDPEVHQDRRDNFGPVTVPPDSYFVMGDNRDQSLDSRFWGFVKLNKIRGKAFLVYWSWDGADTWVRWSRIGRVIQ